LDGVRALPFQSGEDPLYFATKFTSAGVLVPGNGKKAEEWSSKDKFGVVLETAQIVPTLVDRGDYVASESTIYRVMRAAAQQHHRGRAKKSAAESLFRTCKYRPN
jgi:hypothetical protein